MNGTSGSYAINGVELSLQPSTANWVGRDKLGTDGNNRPIYPSIHSFEMKWELMPVSDLSRLINAQLSSVTGSLVVDLPKWGDANYTFYSYSGTYVDEPEVGEYFVEHITNVRFLINNVRTN
jgi:hypothetical protein